MATRPPCPPGMSWITPGLTVKNAETAIDWYGKTFGFEKKFAMPGPDGKIVHAQLIYQGHSIMLTPEGAFGCPSQSPVSSGAKPAVGLYVYCADVDALYARAKAAGAKIDCEPMDQFWGDRICSLTDPDGHSWCFATNIADFDPSKCPTGG
jgi:PhnB protein